MTPRPVDIHIERISVPGPRFNRRQAEVFRFAFERELGGLLARGGLRPARGAAHRHLEAPATRMSAHPAAFGAEVARSLFETLGKSL
jgi:hypothetical protein